MKKFLFLIFLSFSSIFASPQDPTVVSGSANFTQEKNKLNIFSSDDSLIINWKNFDILKDEIVQFIQPTNDSYVLNRVIGLDKTKIFGTLLSNGSIFLINPNGIFTSKEAKIDVGSLLFSTLSLKDDDFLNNKDSLSFINESEGIIENFADIKSKKDVYLLSTKIENFGNIEAQSGNILIGCGNNILIKPKESESLFILCDLSENFEKKQDVGINLEGDIKANRVEIKADGNLYELAIKQNSNVEAVSLCNENGKIYLKATNGNISIENSSLKAKKEFKGGEILITGSTIAIDNSKIDVSHELDGGNVYIGGKKQGLDKNVQNAKETFIGKNVFIDASSENLGSGGEVIVWSDDTTNFYGSIYSKGGKKKGDGGFVEVSGLNRNVTPSG
ncbi:MAG: filamentous hemagglutinin N-terminal domain-containing protein [Parachlamydiales bacterium]|nr:filamentous hemagglutinin N-terminal domain-containing protein [Parachlamydiales bacterium]